jgi:phosphoglycolate phosphatase
VAGKPQIFPCVTPRSPDKLEIVTRFRTVLFDLDGTLLDHFAAIHRTHTQTCQHFGLPAPTMEQVRRAIGGGLETAVARIFGPKHEALVPQAIPVYRALWPDNLLFEASLLAGTKELLQELKAGGAKCAVFTNKHGPSARAVLEHLGVSSLLDGIFGAFDTPWLKPDVKFAQHVLSALGAEANGSCLVGDSPYDIEAAKAAGFPCFCVTTGTHSAEELREAGAQGVYPDLLTLGRSALL